MRLLIILLLYNAHPLCLLDPFHHCLKSACVLVHSTILLEERSTAGSILPGVNPKGSSTSQQLTRQSNAEMPYSLLISQLAANLRHEPCDGLGGAFVHSVTWLRAAMHACRMLHCATDIPAVLALLRHWEPDLRVQGALCQHLPRHGCHRHSGVLQPCVLAMALALVTALMFIAGKCNAVQGFLCMMHLQVA